MPWIPGTLPDTRLMDIAQSVLDRIKARFAEAGVAVPTRSYIHSGEVSLDFGCEDQLVVTFLQLYSGQPGPSAQAIGKPMQSGVPLTAVFSVVLTRCVPNVDEDGNPPETADLQASGEMLLTDYMTMVNIIADEEFVRTLIPEPYSLAGIGYATPYGPRGGVGGVLVQLEVSII